MYLIVKKISGARMTRFISLIATNMEQQFVCQCDVDC